MQHLDGHNLIQSSPLFHALQAQEQEAIFARLQRVRYVRGTHILERNVWHGQLYVIAEGEVSVLLHDDEYIVARLGRGECFGEMSLITGELPNATIRAEQDVTLLALAQSDFLALLSVCPTLLKNINTILSQRLTRANQHLAASQRRAEFIHISVLDKPDAAPNRMLTLHIAAALAQRTRKRVLHLELCATQEATGPHFAVHATQLRSNLLDANLLQSHHVPLEDHVPAIAVLADTVDAYATPDAHVTIALTDIALLYDYILLVATPQTPQWILAAIEKDHETAISQQIVLIAADRVAREQSEQVQALVARLPNAAYAVFVTHVPGMPTIGAQDSYTQHVGCAVTRLLPADATLLEQCWKQQHTLDTVAPDAALSKAVDFVARHIARQTIGIAFGGGGARGFAHLGVLDGLLTHGVPLDYIAACSSGIIASGMYLIGKSLAESEEIFLDIQRHIVQWNISRTSLFSNKGLKQMLRELCGDLRFEDLTTPFAMVAVDLSTRAGVVLDRGPLWQAGLASVSLPGIFPPVIVGDHILMDAGMHDPVPIRLARKMGAHILLASELGGQEPPALESATPWLVEATRKGQAQHTQQTPHVVDLLLRTYDLAMATIGMHSIREADVVIRPTLHRVSLRQFSEGRKFVKAGREAVEQMLPELQKHAPWVR